MVNAALNLERHLEQLCARAAPGDRLPTVRALMREFGVSQGVVQRAMQSLKTRGLIAPQVGRGTYFQPPSPPPEPVAGMVAPAVPARVRSVLLLRRAASVARGRALVDLLQQRLVADGHSVLEVAYTDPEHARAALQGLPRFDACVLQSNFKAIPTDLLAAVRTRAEIVAVDGLALVGMDVESVGTEWGEPLEAAILSLHALGHRAIAFAHSALALLPTQLGQRRLEGLRERRTDLRLHDLAVPQLPGPGYEQALVQAFTACLRQCGADAPTALVAVGIDDGVLLRSVLQAAGLPVPDALSVVLLGRTDIAEEHADFFDTIGCSVADQAKGLHAAIAHRWADPQRPHSVQLIPLARRPGRSCAAPAGQPITSTPGS